MKIPAALQRMGRKPAMAILPGLVFTTNLFCAGICDLEARSVPIAESASGTQIHSSCQHHHPRSGTQKTASRAHSGHDTQFLHHQSGPTSGPHDDASCPSCVRPSEPSPVPFHPFTVPVLTILPLPELVERSSVHLSFREEEGQVWPPEDPLYLKFNVLRI